MSEMENLQIEEGEGQENTTPDGAQNTEDGKQQGPPKTVPYDRLQEVIAERNKLREDVDALRADMQKIKEKEDKDRTRKMEEQEQFKELADEWKAKFEAADAQVKSASESLEAHQAALTGYADSQMERVPELYRTVVEKLPLLERLTWLSENAEKLEEQSKTASIPRTPKGQGVDKTLEAERRRRGAKTF